VHGVAHQYDYKQRRSKVSTPLIYTLWSVLNIEILVAILCHFIGFIYFTYNADDDIL
jgi:hypothetical protein